MNHAKTLLSLILLLALHCRGFSQDTIPTRDGAFLEAKTVDDSVLQTYKRLIKIKLFNPTTFGYEQLLGPRMSFEIAGSMLELNAAPKADRTLVTGGFISAGLKLMPKQPRLVKNSSNPLASEYLRFDLAYANLTEQYYELEQDTAFTTQAKFVTEKRESYALLLGAGVQFNITPRFLADIHLSVGAAYSEVNSNSITSANETSGPRSYGSHTALADDFALAHRLGWSISYLLK